MYKKIFFSFCTVATFLDGALYKSHLYQEMSPEVRGEVLHDILGRNPIGILLSGDIRVTDEDIKKVIEAICTTEYSESETERACESFRALLQNVQPKQQTIALYTLASRIRECNNDKAILFCKKLMAICIDEFHVDISDGQIFLRFGYSTRIYKDFWELIKKEIFDWLISKGATLSTRDFNGRTMLWGVSRVLGGYNRESMKEKDRQILEYFLEKNISINVVDNTGMTILDWVQQPTTNSYASAYGMTGENIEYDSFRYDLVKFLTKHDAKSAKHFTAQRPGIIERLFNSLTCNQ